MPSIGRIVHYIYRAADGVRIDKVGEERPAIITRVNDSICVDLQVFTDGLNDFVDGNTQVHKYSVLLSEEKDQGTWHWPGYVGPTGGRL